MPLIMHDAFSMALPFSDIMRVRLAGVLIMRMTMPNFMRRMCSIMRGAFSLSEALRMHLAHVLIMRAFVHNIMRGVRWIMHAGLSAGIAHWIRRLYLGGSDSRILQVSSQPGHSDCILEAHIAFCILRFNDVYYTH